jgi:hypothetical protein
MIATPAHDHRVNSFYLMGVIHSYMSGKFDLDWCKVGGAGIARARNNCVYEFKKTNRDWLMWVDSDIRWGPQHLERLVGHNVPIVGGLYTHKTRNTVWCIDRADLKGPDFNTGLQACEKIGTGFMLTHRDVYTQMEKAYPEMAYVEDLEEHRGQNMFGYFADSVFHDPGFGPFGRWLTEDWYFCWRARQLKIPIHVDVTFWLGHEGMFEYPVDKPKMLAKPGDKLPDIPAPSEPPSEETAITLSGAFPPSTETVPDADTNKTSPVVSTTPRAG